MAIIITNQAKLNYKYGSNAVSTVSNVVSTVLNSAMGITKTSLSDNYKVGQNLTYIITVENNSGAIIEDIRITDNLGSYKFNGITVTPLTYIGNAQLFVNGIFIDNISPTIGNDEIIFEIEQIPANGNIQILYLAQVNNFANGAIGSTITNTATAENNCDCPCEVPVSDSNTIAAEEFANVQIVKSICPSPVICGERITYSFDLQNYGNITATDVVLIDIFNPMLTDIEVTINGNVISADDYTYLNGTLILPAEDSAYEITIPPATFLQNPETGIITITPGTVQIKVSGNI